MSGQVISVRCSTTRTPRLVAMRLRVTLCAVIIGVATGFAPVASRADSAEIIPLTAIDAYAPTALWTLVFIEYFIPEVDRRLAVTGNYQIKWNKAFGGTIAKTRGVLDALQYDLADIGRSKACSP